MCNYNEDLIIITKQSDYDNIYITVKLKWITIPIIIILVILILLILI